MSSSTVNIPATGKLQKQPLSWSLWARQVRAIFLLEIEKNFLGRRSILLYLLALLPIFPLSILALFTPPSREWQDFTQYHMIYAVLYGGLILRTVVFFGCAWIFMNLFRGEIVDRSLHFYFLSAMRREVLVVGKYLSGLITSIILFGGMTIVTIVLLYFPHFYSESVRYFFDGPGLGQLFTYAGITYTTDIWDYSFVNTLYQTITIVDSLKSSREVITDVNSAVSHTCMTRRTQATPIPTSRVLTTSRRANRLPDGLPQRRAAERQNGQWSRTPALPPSLTS